MDAPLRELARLEKLQSFPSTPHPSSSKTTVKSAASVSETLDSLLQSLQELKQGVEAGATSEIVVQDLARLIDEKKKEIDEKQKEIHASLGKVGKAIDKVMPLVLAYACAILSSTNRSSQARYHPLLRFSHLNPPSPRWNALLLTISCAQDNLVQQTHFLKYVGLACWELRTYSVAFISGDWGGCHASA